MHTVIGAFDDRNTAQRAVERLVQAGFDRDDVHVEEGSITRDGMSSGQQDGMVRDEAGDRGAMSSFGAFFASLFGMDEPSKGQAGTYSEAVRRGSSVVVVDADDEQEAERAATLFDELGAFDVDERANQWRASGWTGSDDTQQMGAMAPAARGQVGDGEGAMDVVQEELKIGKRAVDGGGVRVVQRVSEKPVREILKLREEHAVVDRRPVDRPATEADLSNFKEGTLEVREMSEEAVVGKTARVVEEVRVGKEVREREETIEDSVRRKDVDIERIEGAGGRTEVERERAFAADRNLAPDRSETMSGRDEPTPLTRKTGKTDKPGR